MVTIRDLFRFSLSFRFGSIILIIVAILLLLSFFSPFESDDRRVVPRNEPPSLEYILGTTGNGQDGFWILTFAIRNTLLVSGLAVLIGRSIAVMLGMITGYLGGRTDRVISSIVDSVIVIPRLPLLILIAVIMRGEMTVLSLALLLGFLDWAHPSKRYRAMILSLREREFTHTAVFSGMNIINVVVKGAFAIFDPLATGRCGGWLSLGNRYGGDAVRFGFERLGRAQHRHLDLLGQLSSLLTKKSHLDSGGADCGNGCDGGRLLSGIAGLK